jgi:hypothetical protein
MRRALGRFLKIFCTEAENFGVGARFSITPFFSLCEKADGSDQGALVTIHSLDVSRCPALQARCGFILSFSCFRHSKFTSSFCRACINRRLVLWRWTLFHQSTYSPVVPNYHSMCVPNGRSIGGVLSANSVQNCFFPHFGAFGTGFGCFERRLV